VQLIILGALFTAIALLVAGHSRAVGRVIAGGFLFLLGYASVVPDLSVLESLPQSFLAVSAGFIWLGLAFVIRGVVEGARERGKLLIAALKSASLPALIILSVAALVPLLYTARGTLLLASWRGPLAAVGLGGAGVFVVTLFSVIKVARAWKWLDDKWLTRWSEGSPALLPGSDRLKSQAAFACVFIVVVLKHLVSAAIGTILFVFLLHDVLRSEGKAPRWWLQPVIVSVALTAVTWFCWTIAGPDISLTVAGLKEAPFSAAAEMTLAPMLGLAAWALMGLWPLHGAGTGSALAFLGGLLLTRWGAGVIPGGMEHMAPLAGIVAAVASLHAASRRRSGELAAALGVLALTPVMASGLNISWVVFPFFAVASIPAILWIRGEKTILPGLDRHQMVGLLLLPLLAVALPWMLRGETFLTVVTMLAGATLFAVPKE
jgi:hypothetical protein